MINSLLNAKKKINNALATIDASAAEFLKNNYEKIYGLFENAI